MAADTVQAVNNWGPAALIVFGYIVAAFWQNKRIEDLKDWIKAEFKAINEKFNSVNQRLDSIDKRLDLIEGRVKALEEARSSGVIGVR